MGLGIAALTGVTSWAVASVSIWLVPVYLSLMVLTFAMPRAGRAGSPAAESTTGKSGAYADETGQGTGADRAEVMGEPSPDAEPVPDIPATESVEAPTSQPDPAGTAAAKPRRSRSRSRKAAKSAVEAIPDPGPVTWIRVGPGKFVRADAYVQDSPQAQAEEVSPAANPETDPPEAAENPTDRAAESHPEMGGPQAAPAPEAHPETDDLSLPVPMPEEVASVADVIADAPEPSTADVPTDASESSEADVITEPTVPAAPASETEEDAGPVRDALEAVAPAPSPMVPFEVPGEPSPPDPPDSDPAVEETVPSSVEEVTGSDAEEYGIAPSAFGAETPGFPEAEVLVPGVLDKVVPPAFDSVNIADPIGPPTAGGARSSRPGSRRRRSWVRQAVLLAGIANVSQGRGAEPESLRRRLHARPRPRAVVRCSSDSDSRLRQMARRAFDRTYHVQRARRPRSPPGRSP